MKRLFLQMCVFCLCVVFTASIAHAGSALKNLADIAGGGGASVEIEQDQPESRREVRSGSIETISLDGLEKVLEEHAGKIVLINFFATWCPPCKEEIPGLVSIARKRGKEVVIVGLSVDQKPELLPDFIKEYNINYDVYVADAEVRKTFEVKTIPHNAVFDQEGEIVANESGYVSEREVNNFIDKLLEK